MGRRYAPGTHEELSQFIGKDVWVQATLKNPSMYAYIRILSEDIEETTYDSGYTSTHRTYTINLVPVLKVSRAGICRCLQSFKDSSMSRTYKKDEYDIRIHHPLECLTTDEFFETPD